jgi:predicted nuclease of predicted toxin-antitoxin system
VTVRFLLDQDVDARVAKFLRSLGHEAWTAADAGLAQVSDDEITVYAMNKRAVVLTHDHEFSIRRSKNVCGHHIYLDCNEWSAAELLTKHLKDVLPIMARKPDLYVCMTVAKFTLSRGWK